jgi:hypothetical protein
VNRFNRTQILTIATLPFAIFAIVYHIWAGWGLVTIHAKGTDLGKVIASMARQGHAKIETDMPSSTPVSMDVDKVPLAFALEKLSIATSSRWRLLYFAAGDKATLQSGEDAWATGQQPADWTIVSIPFGNNAIELEETDPPILDPREDTYTPKAAAPAPIQTFFSEAAQLTNAGFAYPTAWNPTVSSTPPSGAVVKVIPKLVSKASGREDMVFFLSANGNGPGPGFAGANMDPDLLAQRVQDEINRLPPEEKTEAQNNFDAEKAFRASLATMSDDDRRAAFMAHMQDPTVQGAMMNRQDAREGMMNHDQRMQRFQNYVNRKLAATGKM